MILYVGKVLFIWVLYFFIGLYENDKLYLMNIKVENCLYWKRIISRYYKKVFKILVDVWLICYNFKI